MNNKMPSREGTSNFDLSALAGTTAALEAARWHTSTNIATEFAALQASMRPAEEIRRQFDALAPTRSIRAVMEQYRLVNVHLSAMQAAEPSAMEQIRRCAQMPSVAARIAAFDSTMLARTKAIEKMLSPSKMAAKYIEELTTGRALQLAAEQAKRWSAYHYELVGAFERFQEPLSISSARTFLESMAKASEPFGARRLLEDAAQLSESDEAREDVVLLVQGIAEGVSNALTAQEAVDQIVQAIQANKEPLHQKLLFTILVPVLIAIVFAFVTPIADFHVKKRLEGAPQQEVTKQVKAAAREAIGDVRLLNGFRFVSSQSLALKTGPKAKAPVVGQLRFGQTVRILEQERDFTLVAWRSEDGKVELQGWVFSRYLKRFN